MSVFRGHTRVVDVTVALVLAASVVSSSAFSRVLIAQGSVVRGDPDSAGRVQRLSNGLTVYLHRTPYEIGKAELRLVVRAGSAYETEAQRGAAFLAFQLALQETPRFPADSLKAFFKAIANFNGDSAAYSASVTEGATIYRVNVPSDSASVAKAVMLLSDWARMPVATPLQLEGARARAIALASTRSTFSLRAIDSLQSVGTRLAEHPPFGTKATLGALDGKEVTAFRTRWYRPDNMAVIISSDIPFERSLQLATAAFGDIPPAAGAIPARPVMSFPPRLVTAVAADSQVKEPAVYVALYRPPPVKGDTTAENANVARDSLVSSRYAQMLTVRLAELAFDTTVSFNDADVTVDGNQAAGFRLIARVTPRGTKPQQITGAAERVIAEIVRIGSHGFTDQEYSNMLVKRVEAIPSGDATVMQAGQYTADFIRDVPSLRPDQSRAQRTVLTPALTGETLREQGRLWSEAPRRIVVASLPTTAATKTASATRTSTTLASASATAFTRKYPQLSVDDDRLRVVALIPVPGKTLTNLLADIANRAAEMGFIPIAELGATWCAPCHSFAKLLPTPKFRKVFDRVYLVRIDVDLWKSAASELGGEGLPAFVGIGRDGRSLELSQSGIGESKDFAELFTKCRAKFYGK